jgi:hypothetical protein
MLCVLRGLMVSRCCPVDCRCYERDGRRADSPLHASAKCGRQDEGVREVGSLEKEWRHLVNSSFIRRQFRAISSVNLVISVSDLYVSDLYVSGLSVRTCVECLQVQLIYLDGHFNFCVMIENRVLLS